MYRFYVNYLTIEQCEVSENDVLLFKYPHHIGRVIRIQLINNNTIINYTEKKFANQNKHRLLSCAKSVKAQENDSIFIEYIPKEYSNLVCTLRINNIYEYYCDAYRKRRIYCKKKEKFSEGPLDGLNIRVTKSATLNSPLYFLNFYDWFGVFADEILIQNLRYN